MSECVVRMEMPKACSWIENGEKKKCPISEWGGACAITKQFKMPDGCRPSWCPIVCELPEGHGRLIDADAMAEDVRSLWDYETVDGITASTVLKQIMTDIWNCPTIVPAEAERSET